jgi:hypothetical protein
MRDDLRLGACEMWRSFVSAPALEAGGADLVGRYNMAGYDVGRVREQ